MSYIFDGSGDRLNGTFSSGPYTLPISLVGWIKYPAGYTFAVDEILSLGANSGAVEDNVNIRLASTDGRFVCDTVNAVPAIVGSSNTTPARVNDVWHLIVGVIRDPPQTNDRSVYYDGSATVGHNGTEYDIGTTLQYISAGANLANGEIIGAATPNQVFLAELAIYNKELSTGEIDELVTKFPSAVAASNLIGYWPLNASNTTQANDGLDAGGDLTVTGAVYDAAHPTLSGGAALDPIRLIWRM